MTVADNASLDSIATTLAELRQTGAHQCDPVRFHYLETLCRRAQGQPPTVVAALTEKLRQALAAYQQLQPRQPPAVSAEPAAASGLTDLLRALSMPTETSTIPADALTGTLAGAMVAAGSPTVELKSVRYFRDTWVKLGVEQRVTQSFAKAPENAGPLNSHLLVLQALGRMRDEAPAYLQHFITYADSLLWLAQAVNSLPVKQLTGDGTGEGGKKRKTGKTKPR